MAIISVWVHITSGNSTVIGRWRGPILSRRLRAAGAGPAFEYVIDKMNNICKIDCAVTVLVAVGIRVRRRAAGENVSDEIDRVSDIDNDIGIGISAEMLHRPAAGRGNAGVDGGSLVVHKDKVADRWHEGAVEADGSDTAIRGIGIKMQ